jgi:hypothetical protein
MKRAVAPTLTEHGARCNCSHCYQNGQFVLADISLTEMQARVREKIVEFGMPGFLAGIFTRKIPKLARWQRS